MRNHPAFVAMFTLAIGLSACGRYGPPVRSIPQESTAPTPVPRVERQRMDEEIMAPVDFDDARDDEEQVQ